MAQMNYMKCKIHFFLLNDHFSIEHADANHNGEESEMNRKHEWEDELQIKGDVTEIIEHEKAVYPLKGSFSDEKAFSFDVPNMRLFEIVTESESTFVGCSESILETTELKENDFYELSIYIKDFEPMSNPIPGIFIAAQEFPKELIN